MFTHGNSPSTLWYHDHALGLTRLHVVAGLAGFYIVRDQQSDDVASLLPKGKYEWPLMLQDKLFKEDGSMLFPSDGENPAVHPYWIPEYFGDVIVVNGLAWPNMNVDRAQYFFRLLDASNARFFNLTLKRNDEFVKFVIVSPDQGYLRSPVEQFHLILAPGQRYGVLIDFSSFSAGDKLSLLNSASSPFPDGDPIDPETTGQVMQFTVVDNGNTVVAANLPTILDSSLSTFPSLRNSSKIRRLTLFESIDETTDSPLQGLINGQLWSGPISELPILGSTEDIEWINLTGDAHPLHMHLVSFQIVSRRPFDVDGYAAQWTGKNGPPPYASRVPFELDPSPFFLGDPQEPSASELGWIDTVIAYPGEVTRIRAHYAPQRGGNFPFDATSEPGYVLHCHILDHEDNEMMRPFKVVASLSV